MVISSHTSRVDELKALTIAESAGLCTVPLAIQADS